MADRGNIFQDPVAVHIAIVNYLLLSIIMLGFVLHVNYAEQGQKLNYSVISPKGEMTQAQIVKLLIIITSHF